MIQRSHKDEKDPAAGTWEFPGGGREPGDPTSLHSGIREFEEETGHEFPLGGHVQHVWQSPNGVYQGHVVVVPSESVLDFSKGRSTVNPDDPDGDDHEQSAWWHPDDARKNPALRPECKSSPWDKIKTAALRTEGSFEAFMRTAGNADVDDLASSPTITRGIRLGNGSGTVWRPDEALRISRGIARPHDLLRHINRADVGDFWHGHHDSLGDAKGYAEGDLSDHVGHEVGHPDALYEGGDGTEGHIGEVGVVLEAHRPKGWDPNKNPENGMMGNSYLSHPTELQLHKIHYDDHHGNWHSIDAGGATVKATGYDPDQPKHYGGSARTAVGLWGEHKALGWDEIGERHPHVYGDPEVHGEEADGADGEGIGFAANHLAHSRPEDPEAEGGMVHDLTFREEEVHPKHIDYAPSGRDDPRVKSAMQGYRTHADVPPVVLVHRHGVYYPADGHHRAEAAHLLSRKIKAYVADSPHPHEPFETGSRGEAKGPFFRAEPVPGYHEASLRTADYASHDSLADVQPDWRPKPPARPLDGAGENPGSTGFATAGDPPEFGDAATRAQTMSLTVESAREMPDWETPGKHVFKHDDYDDVAGVHFPRGSEVHVKRFEVHNGVAWGVVDHAQGEAHVTPSSLMRVKTPGGADDGAASWQKSDRQHRVESPGQERMLHHVLGPKAERNPEDPFRGLSQAPGSQGHFPWGGHQRGNEQDNYGLPWHRPGHEKVVFNPEDREHHSDDWHGGQPDTPDGLPIRSLNVLHEEPEAALPSTDGGGDDGLDDFAAQTPGEHFRSNMSPEIGATDLSGNPNSVHAARTTQEIVAAFQATAAATQLQGTGGGKDGMDIASAARAYLSGDTPGAGMQKAALKDFSFSEQQELISEGAADGTVARNLGDLQIEGTHYASLEATLAAQEQGDPDDLFD
jgi:8-oxo-dGTP pyrophosphatase MutT (NUDIX family)